MTVELHRKVAEFPNRALINAAPVIAGQEKWPLPHTVEDNRNAPLRVKRRGANPRALRVTPNHSRHCTAAPPAATVRGNPCPHLYLSPKQTGIFHPVGKNRHTS